jgi:hypothetical protein
MFQFTFCLKLKWNFKPKIRIRVGNTDPDPATQISTDTYGSRSATMFHVLCVYAHCITTTQISSPKNKSSLSSYHRKIHIETATNSTLKTYAQKVTLSSLRRLDMTAVGSGSDPPPEACEGGCAAVLGGSGGGAAVATCWTGGGGTARTATGGGGTSRTATGGGVTSRIATGGGGTSRTATGGGVTARAATGGRPWEGSSMAGLIASRKRQIMNKNNTNNSCQTMAGSVTSWYGWTRF